MLDVKGFAEYWDAVARRTRQVVTAIPPDQFDWVPRPGEFTFGDLARHIASSRRMNIMRVIERRHVYPGHDRVLAPSLAEALSYLDTTTSEVRRGLQTLTNADLERQMVASDGVAYPVWRFLVAMIEHEVHHRSQLCCYLSQISVAPPALFGLYVEDLPTE